MKKEKVFWGLLLVLSGIFIIVSKLGYLSDINVVSIIITAFLLAFIVKSIIKVNFGGILFPLAFIAIIYDDKLGITSITPWTVLIAALLGTIGLSLIFNKGFGHCTHKTWTGDCNYEKINVEDESHIKLDVSFGGIVKYINTDKFVQAELDCSFGSMQVYFDNADMANETAILKLDVSFGGVEIYVPKKWRIEDRTSVSFGGLEIKNSNTNETSGTLILVGDVSFAGVDIYYV